MILLKIDQNTEEWEEFRKGKSGGSAFGKLYKINGRTNDAVKDQFFSLLAERVARPMTPNDYMDRIPDGVPFSWAVRGHILEDDAAKLFSEKYGIPLMDGYVWADENNLSSYVSPDRAIIGKDGEITEAVEIKCLSSEKVLKVWWNKKHLEAGKNDFWAIPSNEYQAQVLKYFMVNEKLEKLYWVVYTDLIPELEMQVLEIKREDVASFIDDAKKVEAKTLKMLDEAVEELNKMQK